MMQEDVESKLAAPGAGLPAVELLVARLLFGFARRTLNRDSFDLRFQKERRLIRELLGGCDGEFGARRVLIERLPGLEDSSRYWSVWMTLDHLRIVHHEFARVIRALTRGEMPEGKASTAAVKPNAKATSAVVAPYEESCDALTAVVTGSPELKTTLRYDHPWFGPLDAAGWHALAGGHMRIHRVQIERILRGIARSSP